MSTFEQLSLQVTMSSSQIINTIKMAIQIAMFYLVYIYSKCNGLMERVRIVMKRKANFTIQLFDPESWSTVVPCDKAP